MTTKHSKKEIVLNAEREIAWESLDHLNPWGTARDNSRNFRFNEKVYQIFSDKMPIKVLDMGCSGGGFIKDCFDSGCLAVGLEGSDFSKIYKRAEWRTIPEYLFTCDITKPFNLFIKDEKSKDPLTFDLITSWEVLEHIHERDLAQLSTNVKNHLNDSGLFIVSVSTKDDIINGVNLHQTVQEKDWWIEKFRTFGLFHIEGFLNYFNDQYIRGSKSGESDSFHLILSKNLSLAPNLPKTSVFTKILDYWLGSKLQIKIGKFFVGPRI